MLPAWQQPVWSRLSRSLIQGRLAHALLITGPPGVGKSLLARLLARSLLCMQPAEDGMACATCRGCVQFDCGSHPDLFTLEPGEEGRQIRVDPVRDFNRKLFMSAQHGGRRVGIIEPAEALNPYAANSLLKTLEEPPPDSHVLLVSERPGSVMATIRSRCQTIRLALPDAASLQDWLRQQPDAVQQAMTLARGAPLRAEALAAAGVPELQVQWLQDLQQLLAGRVDLVELAARWSKTPLPELLDWLYLVIADVLKLQMRADTGQLVHAAHGQTLQGMAESLDAQRLGSLFVPRLQTTRRLLDTTVDTILLMEQLLITLRGCRK